MVVMVSNGLLFAACARQQAAVAPAGTPAQKNEIYVVVQRGQSVDTLAARFNIPKADIIAINGLKSPYRLKPGGILKLPITAAQLNPEKQEDEEPVAPQRPPEPTATTATIASPTPAPERAQRPSRPQRSEKPKPFTPQVIPLD